MLYRVLIPTAGLGKRLGKQTKYINKSLISINHKPAISHIIESYPSKTEFVIALGYKGNLVKDFLELAYPNKVFYFAYVTPYEGSGSGLGLSLIACEKYLQEPFVFISCDTLVKGDIKKPDHNWMGYANMKGSSRYRTLSIDNNEIYEIIDSILETGIEPMYNDDLLGEAFQNMADITRAVQLGWSPEIRIKEGINC